MYTTNENRQDNVITPVELENERGEICHGILYTSGRIIMYDGTLLHYPPGDLVELIRQQIDRLTAKISIGGQCNESGCEGLTQEQSDRLEWLFQWESHYVGKS